MFRPNAGDLLAGVAAGLRQSVLPALEQGHAQRQLKAALQVLTRLQRSWNLQADYLTCDNEDIYGTMQSVLEALRLSGLTAPASTAAPATSQFMVSGNELTATNITLQARLIELDSWLRAPTQLQSHACATQRTVLEHLYRRMVCRELRAWGTEDHDE